MRVIRSAWGVVAISVIASMSIAFGITVLITPEYESRAQMFVSTSNQIRSDVYETNVFSQQVVGSYAELATGTVLASKVVSDLGLDLTPAELTEKVTTSYSPATVVFDIVATDNSPELARDIANTMGTELSELVSAIEVSTNGDAPSHEVKFYSLAEASDSPISPNTVMYLAIGAVVGLLIGSALVLARHRIASR
ncbi:YveK family protein [Rhodococcus sp. MALMAid1271]|uniref:YveK family protein n=1 Tax=Rhodococcus sp. MALMAid1271 TaxID=3411744 RepID=UPI003B9ECDD1